jgi:hypothetical protein
MQCCGEAFRIGSQVDWTLREPDQDWLNTVLGDTGRATVDAAEEHHADLPSDAPRSAGRVTRIQAVHCRYAPKAGSDARALYPVAGSGVKTDIDSADGWTPDDGEFQFAGYLVQIVF